MCCLDAPLMSSLSAAAVARIGDFQARQLSNTAWAFAVLGCADAPLFDAITSAAGGSIASFRPQELANTAWSLAALGFVDSPLLAAIAGAAVSTIRADMAPGKAGLFEAGTSVLGVVEALQAAGRLDDGLLGEAADFLAGAAGAVDANSGGRPVALSTTMPAAAAGSREPYVLVDEVDLCILWKPPGWTVSVGTKDRLALAAGDDGDDPSYSGPLGRPLEEWVAARLGPTCPIARDAGFMHGLVHRLDRDTSGMLACAKTYRGFYAAQLQFASREVSKEYVCLCAGHLDLEGPLLVDAPLRAVLADGAGRALRSVVDEVSGARAATELRASCRLTAPDGSPATLVEVRLHTGRLHQIRAHLGHLGHPLVGDAAYGGAAAWPEWCPRLFLHSHRLALRLGRGAPLVDARTPLPDDLRAVLGRLAPAEGADPSVLGRWMGGAR